MKVGLIRCQQTEDMCPSITCLKVMKEKKGAFEGIEEDVELVSVNTCGGCPGKKVATRAKKMVSLGADTIVLGSCLKLGTPIGFPCPHYEEIKRVLDTRIKNARIIDWTH
jgi:predicted metal-binding protein